jgi:hypothetical protein
MAPASIPILGERRRDHAPFLGDQRLKQVLGRDFGMIALLRLGLRRRDGFLRLVGELVEPHTSNIGRER